MKKDITILIGKTLSRTVTWTGVGAIDKGFGFLFGFFKGYINIKQLEFL